MNKKENNQPEGFINLGKTIAGKIFYYQFMK